MTHTKPTIYHKEYNQKTFMGGQYDKDGLINMIREKAQKGKSAYAISKELGISINTIKKYIRQPRKDHGLKGRTKPSKLDPFKPKIKEMIKKGMKLRLVNRRRWTGV